MNDRFGAERAAEMVADAESWDLSATRDATIEDIPVIDVERLFATGDIAELDLLADQLRCVGENVGFHFLVGHGIDPALTEQMFEAVASLLTAPDSVKQGIAMDSPDAALPGIGYMAVGERRLPERAKGNLNEAVVFKQDRAHRLADNMWPDPADVPGFRETVSTYAAEIERVAMGLLPLYARALGLPAGYFDAVFASPFYRLRMTRYAPVEAAGTNEFGIAPHVDTTFFTLLAQNSPGLTIYGEQQQTWLRAPVVPGALVVNTGELLKQWSNGRFLSIKHYVPPHQGHADRYSVPFFFNATADYPMTCLPTCTDDENPPRHPTVSYLESQAASQHEYSVDVVGPTDSALAQRGRAEREAPPERHGNLASRVGSADCPSIRRPSARHAEKEAAGFGHDASYERVEVSLVATRWLGDVRRRGDRVARCRWLQ